MCWDEFCTLLAGIMPETPLGKIVSIRSESDKDMLKSFTKEQHSIRNKWRSRTSKTIKINKTEARRQIKEFQNICKNAFGK